MNSAGTYESPERRAALQDEFPRPLWGRRAGGQRGTITDLCAGGCFVLTDYLVEEGELVRIELALAEGEELALWGHVILALKETGFAVRFSAFPQGDALRKLTELLARVARER